MSENVRQNIQRIEWFLKPLKMGFKPTRYFQNLHNPSDVMDSTLLTNILVVYILYTTGLASKAEDVLKIVFNNYTLDAIAHSQQTPPAVRDYYK